MEPTRTLLALLLLIGQLATQTVGAADATSPEIFAPSVISGPLHDAAPAFTPDGDSLVFSRSTPQGSTLLMSHRQNGTWSAPEIAPFSGTWSDMEPAYAPDGSFLVFVSNRPATGDGAPLDGHYNGKVQAGGGGNLWRIDYTHGHWGKPQRLPDTINDGDSIFAPAVAADASLYFMRPSTGTGKFQLFRSQYSELGYATPEPLPFSDGSSTDVDPAVAPDESFLVFGSGRAPAESMDLFLVRRDAGRWGTPEHLGKTINSPGSDAEARLSPDRRTLYFSSERTLPIHFPRTPGQAAADLKRTQHWDNGLYNIWHVSLAPWLHN